MDTVATVAVDTGGETRFGGGSGVVGGFIHFPVKAVAAVGPGSVGARLVDVDRQVDGAVIASVQAVVEEECVPNGALTESLVSAARSRTDVEQDAVAACDSGIFGVGTRLSNGKGEGVDGHTMGGGVGVVYIVNTRSGESLTSPSFGATGFLFSHVGGVGYDVEGQIVDGVASYGGVGDSVGVDTAFGIGVAIPVVVATNINGFIDIQRGDNVQGEYVVVNAIVGSGGGGVVARVGISAVVPIVAATGRNSYGVVFNVGNGEHHVENAVA